MGSKVWSKVREPETKILFDSVKGIISSLAFSPSYSPDECFYAAGSLNPTSSNIAMFSDATPNPVMFLDGGPGAGVTQVLFVLYPGLNNCIELISVTIQPHETTYPVRCISRQRMRLHIQLGCPIQCR